MRIICLACMLSVYTSASYAQSLPDSLRQPVEIRVTGEPELSARIKDHLAINLISAEATVVDHSDTWILNIAVSRFESDNNIVAISMIASQPNLQPEQASLSTEKVDIESGEWIKSYLEREYSDGLSKIQQHEVVITEATDLDRAARELVEKFRHRFLDSIKEMHLRRIQNN